MSRDLLERAERILQLAELGHNFAPEDAIEIARDYRYLAEREQALTRALEALKLHADNRRDGRLDRAAVFEYAISIGWPEVVGSQAATAKHFNVTPAAISYILKPKRRAMGAAKVDAEDHPPV